MNLFDTITNEEVQKLPLKLFEGDIHIVDGQPECEEAIVQLQRECVVGFDTETKPTFVKGKYHPTAII